MAIMSWPLSAPWQAPNWEQPQQAGAGVLTNTISLKVRMFCRNLLMFFQNLLMYQSHTTQNKIYVIAPKAVLKKAIY
jgi:hypothetical protein